MRFHDLRHTFASQWVLKGGDLFKLQKILGHQSVQMTMRYAHLAPDAFREDYQRLNGASVGATPRMKSGPISAGTQCARLNFLRGLEKA